MLTNDFPVRADREGDTLQQYAAQISAIDPHAVIPHDHKEARALLDKLTRERTPRETASDRRYGQWHEAYNAMLPVLARAKRMGVRPADTKPPPIPAGGEVSPDALKELQEFSQQLDIDVAELEAQTPDQRRIARLEARLAGMVEHSNNLVTACKNYEERIARLEAVISGPRAA